MLKHTLRFVPLLLMALILIPLRIYTARNTQQNPATPFLLSSPFRPGSALYSVTMISAGDAWAVGGSFVARCDAQNRTSCFSVPASGIILHYSDGAWGGARVKDTLHLPLLGVSLDSSRDGWAVGYEGALAHYDGDTWSTRAGLANFNKNLLGVAMLSPSNGWAVGYGGSILHYDGKQWLQVHSPTQFDLRSIAILSPQEGWAVGDNGTILHYRNGTWSIDSSPVKDTLNHIAMLSTTEGWAVGKQGSILHYRDGVWESVSNPNQSADLYGIAMNSIRSGWISGDYELLTYCAEVWLESCNIFDASGNTPSSKIEPANFNLYSIAITPSGESWTVGRTVDQYGNNAIAILHYKGDTWSLYPR